jgi:hypothetical protein
MWIRCLVFLGVSLLCATCNRNQSSIPPDSIWYSHAGCYGQCPRFEIHVGKDGHGTFEGYSYTAVRGKREFKSNPQRFNAFVNALEPARQYAKPFNEKLLPQIVAGATCPADRSYHTDDSGVFVMWSAKTGEVYYQADFGCDSDRNKQLYEALDKAPEALGLKQMIGKPNFLTPP